MSGAGSGRLADKVAIVTGAARGTGEGIAKRFASEGARVVVTDILDDAGADVAKALGEPSCFEHLDVTRESDWERVVAAALDRYGRIDVLVNNAARLHMGPIENTPPDTFRQIIEVNTVGPYLGTRAVAATMRAGGRGAIVNVSSIDGMLGMNGLSAYVTSKFGLRGLTKATALELGRDGIRVNCVCPAGGNPEMFGAWAGQMESFMDEVGRYSANRAIPGEAPIENIAGAVLYLASDEAAHVTGVDIAVDGGATAGRYIGGFQGLK